MSNQLRYPGARPFTTAQKKVFFGREKDLELFSNLVDLEELVVLYAKSGLGKSSLINAGLIPKLQERNQLHPINIRFGAYIEHVSKLPLENVLEQTLSQSPLINKIDPGTQESIWQNLKSRQLENQDNKGFILIFDQFEELFTYPTKNIEEFAGQLSELIFTNIPERYRQHLEKRLLENKKFLTKLELQQLHLPFNLKVVFVIRSDRMSLLNKLKLFLPNVLENCYELGALNIQQAEDAILNPAYQKNHFISPQFDYEDEAVNKLINFLSEDKTEFIESYQLQILCEHIEQNFVLKQGKKLIKAEDLADPEDILENYYLNKIKEILDEKERLAARRLIEEGLIFEEEERRLTLYQGQIFKNYGVSEALLRKLLDSHLLRSEPSMRGGYTYELSHDTLVAPVLKAKSRRLEVEKKEKEEELRKKAEKERELRLKAEENEQKAKEAEQEAKKQAKRANGLTLIAIIIASLAVGLAIFAFQQYSNSQKARITIGKEKAKSDSLRTVAETQLDSLDAARTREEKAQAQFVIQQITKMLSGSEKLEEQYPKETKELYNEALSILDQYRDNKILQNFRDSLINRSNK